MLWKEAFFRSRLRHIRSAYFQPLKQRGWKTLRVCFRKRLLLYAVSHLRCETAQCNTFQSWNFVHLLHFKEHLKQTWLYKWQVWIWTLGNRHGKKPCRHNSRVLHSSDRKTEAEIIRKMQNAQTQSVVAEINGLEKQPGAETFEKLFKSITADGG